MYELLKNLLSVAEEIGSVATVDMGEWLGDDRIDISGKTREKKEYSLVLTVKKGKENDS